ncbi:MAG: alpha/beta hydrolase [Planctomycetaceae bacterium]|nr:alpha/beta hydrolase [Planctomycetaceae bacterium]
MRDVQISGISQVSPGELPVKSLRFLGSAVVITLALTTPAFSQAHKAPEPRPVAIPTRIEDVIYSRRDGFSLTLDVFTPTGKPNGAGIIICISGDYKSGKELVNFARKLVFPEFLKHGYVVFAVQHGSQPRCTVPEIVEDTHEAVRFIKANAKKYDVSPDKLGIAGMSSGGHLSLMMGCAYKPGDPKASNPVERESSRVAAVACFFPVTDFLVFEAKPPEGFDDLFPFREFDPKAGKFIAITAERRREIGRQYSPLHCATKETVPTLIIHGDEDRLVPLDQSKDLIAKLKECDVVCELRVKQGMGHSPFAAREHLPEIREWFDKHLLKP